jgi:hypothetical protein
MALCDATFAHIGLSATMKKLSFHPFFLLSHISLRNRRKKWEKQQKLSANRLFISEKKLDLFITSLRWFFMLFGLRDFTLCATMVF